MEIILNKGQTMKAVDVAKTFAESASGLKVLQGVFVSAGFGRVRLTTTDLELWCQVELNAQTPQPGTALVPVRGLATVMKNMPQSRVELRSEGDDVVCMAGSSEVRLAGLDVEEYPDVEEPEGRLMSMPLTAALVDKVAYAVSKDETRYTLTGVYVEVEGRQLKLVATDGHRLSRFVGSLPPGSENDAGEEPLKAIVPVRLLEEGVRLGGKLGGSVTSGAVREGRGDPDQRIDPHLEQVDRRPVPRLRGGNASIGVHGYGIGAERRLVQRRVAAWRSIEGPSAAWRGVGNGRFSVGASSRWGCR